MCFDPYLPVCNNFGPCYLCSFQSVQGSENLLADYFYIFDFVNIYICCAITETPRRSSRLTGVSGATQFALSVKLRRSPLRVSLLTDALPFAKYTMHNCYTAPYFLESVFIVVTELLQIFRSILYNNLR